MSRKSFCVREACLSDLPALTNIEERVWRALAAPTISAEVLGQWLELRSPFFLVAETEGAIAGYYFGLCTDFDLAQVDKYTKLDKVKRNGYIDIAHDPGGDSLYGITISSIVPGAGSALYQEVLTRWKNLKAKYYFGYCRLSGFAAYINNLNPDPRKSAEVDLDQTALWYAHACMTAVGGKIWDRCAARPALELPLPPPDPILSFHSKCCGGQFGLLGIVPRFMLCTESKGYAAFMVYQSEE